MLCNKDEIGELAVILEKVRIVHNKCALETRYNNVKSYLKDIFDDIVKFQLHITLDTTAKCKPKKKKK